MNHNYIGHLSIRFSTTSLLCGDRNNGNFGMDKHLVMTGCVDNKMRIFDTRIDVNNKTVTKEISINFSSPNSAKILNIKPTHKESTNYYYICSTEELL